MRNAQSRIKRLISGLKRRRTVGRSFEDLLQPAPLITDFFDREWYLQNNPDVVKSGLDPWVHYLEIGAKERREPRLDLYSLNSLHTAKEHRSVTQKSIAFPTAPEVTARLAVMRAHISKSKKILEFGPLASPIAAKREGFQTYSVDKADKFELAKFYAGHNEVHISKIEDVDFIWKDVDILSAIPDELHHTFDVAIIGHVLEHIPNPIKFFRSLQRLLKPGGYVTLAVPDKRFCFDVFRPLTTTAAWIEAMERDDSVHSRRNLFEFKSMAVARRAAITWTSSKLSLYDMTFVGSSLSDAYDDFIISKNKEQSGYIDAHAWVFTPSSFTLILNECHALGMISLVPEYISTHLRAEFFAHLRLAYRRPINHHERMQLLAECAREQALGFRGVKPARIGSRRSFGRGVFNLFRN